MKPSLALAAAALTLPSIALAEDAPPAPASVVEPGLFEIALELDATVDAESAAAVSVAPDEWADLTVVEVVSHGQRVKKGDPLVVFDTSGLEKQIRDLEASQQVAEIALSVAKKSLETAQHTAPLDLEAAKRTDQVATEALTYFEKTSRAQQEKAVAQSLKSSAFRVDSAREELEQLTKMYEADDLTEETEEIILRRAKNDLESAEFSYESAKLRAKRTLEVDIPRQHITLVDAAERARLAFEQAKADVPLGTKKQQLELEKTERDYIDSVDKLKALRADLKALDVRAPFDGIAYYGQADRGKWATAAAVAKKLKPGGKVLPHEIFITVVSPERSTLKATVAEDKLSPLLTQGVTGTAHLAAAPDTKLPVRLAALGFAPAIGGGIHADLEFEKRPEPAWAPGRTAKVKLSLYRKTDALTVPKAAVESDNGKHFVTVVDGDTRTRTEVTTGRTHGDKTEILSGLTPGAKIVTTP